MWIVVFEGTGLQGSNHLGIRTWTQFKSQQEFNESYRPYSRDNIVAEGVTEQEAIALVRQTSPAARVLAAIVDSHGNPALLEYALRTAAAHAAEDGTLEAFIEAAERIIPSFQPNSMTLN